MGIRDRKIVVLVGLLSIGALTSSHAVAAPADADAAMETKELVFTTSDGTGLRMALTGTAPLEPRPVIVEFSPYGPGSATLDAGEGYNQLLVEIRGTGRSRGRFDALGPQSQADVAEVLAWACEQEWSNGSLGLNGFSASAIMIYNSLHLELPCVQGAVLKSGTHELYRDLLYPGGMQNLVPIAVVLGTIGGATIAQGSDRLADPGGVVDALSGQLATVTDGLQHPTQDRFWHERGFRGDVNDLPILMVAGFYDVESRGAFEAFQELRDDGAHLRVVGAHDGAPAGTDGGVADSRAWLDHWVRGVDNGAAAEPTVELLVGEGSYGDLQAGRFTRITADDWPLPGTRWRSLALDPTPSGTATSANDGTLTEGAPAPARTASYAGIPSLPTATDPYNLSNVGPGAAPLWDMASAEPLGLSWTSAPFDDDVTAVGPASLELRLASTAPETGIWVTLSDVAPDGTARPVAAGRLLSSFPHIDEARSRRDPVSGDVVQPYAILDPKDPATPGRSRLYRVEIWPLGNVFPAGHRLRVHVLGPSALSTPLLPAINTVTAGEGSGSRLLFPVLEPG